MTAKHNPPISEEQIAQATDWVLIMSENPDIAQNAEFARWLSRHESNLTAFNEVAVTYGLAAKLPETVRNKPGRTVSGSLSAVYFALAASVALCCVLLFSRFPPDKQPERHEFATVTGEISPFTLPDDSTLVLDTNSRADTVITAKTRDVHLKKGRIFVDVAHDKTRQFSVAIDDTFAFTALGTAYSVEKEGRGWTLEVYEGTVGIASTLITHAPVKAGWGLRYEERRIHRYQLPEPLVEAKPDWQQHRIVFNDTSLRNAVAEFNRYLIRPIKINDPELASLSLSGTFDLSDSQAFIASIAQLTGATIRDNDESFEIGEISTNPDN